MIFYSMWHYFGVRKLLPVFRKPEVLIDDLSNGYSMVFKVLASIARALWAIIGDK